MSAPSAPGKAQESRNFRVGEAREVSQASFLLGALSSLVLGAGVAGGVHYLATAKALTEEGIDARARLHALPVAAKALAVSTVFSAGAVAAAVAALHFWGGVSAPGVVRVSTWQGALAVLEQSRDMVRGEFQKRLHGADGSPGTESGGSSGHAGRLRT